MKSSIIKFLITIIILHLCTYCSSKNIILTPFIEHYNKESLYTNHVYIANDNDIYFVSGDSLYKIKKDSNALEFVKKYDNSILFLDSKNNEIRLNYIAEEDKVVKHNNGDYTSLIENSNYDVIKKYSFNNDPNTYSNNLSRFFYENGVETVSQSSIVYQYNDTGTMVSFKGTQEYNSYYFKDIYIWCDKNYISINKLDYSDKHFKEYTSIYIGENEIIHGISKYNGLYYFIGRSAKIINSNPDDDGFDPSIDWKYFYGDVLYTYNLENKELNELFNTENIIIRYDDNNIYYLNKEYDLYMHSLKNFNTSLITSINKSTIKIENVQNYIFFYYERDLLGILDTRNNKLLEIDVTNLNVKDVYTRDNVSIFKRFILNIYAKQTIPYLSNTHHFVNTQSHIV